MEEEKYTFDFNMTVNAKPGYQFVNINADCTVPTDSSPNFHHDKTITFIDNFGNTGKFVAKLSGNNMEFSVSA